MGMGLRRGMTLSGEKSPLDWGILLKLPLAVVLAFSAIAPDAANADEKGWVLTQKSQTLGDQYVYISSSGMKCYNPRIGFTLVSHAPDWNVTLYNEKTKVYFQTSVEEWSRNLSAQGMTSEMSSKGWNRSGSSTICGLKATEYDMSGSKTALMKTRKGTRRATISNAKYWVSDEIRVPPQLAGLLAAAYGLPSMQNVPLRLACIDKGQNKTLLDTYRSQSASIPNSYYQVPNGMKLVKSEAEVMMTDEQNQILNDMVKESRSDVGAPAGAASTAAPSQGTAQARTGNGSAPASTTIGGVKIDRDTINKLMDAFKKKQ